MSTTTTTTAVREVLEELRRCDHQLVAAGDDSQKWLAYHERRLRALQQADTALMTHASDDRDTLLDLLLLASRLCGVAIAGAQEDVRTWRQFAEQDAVRAARDSDEDVTVR